MATNCYACGYRDNEVKSGGEVSAKGKKITLKVEDEEDLSRDMLKVSSTPHLDVSALTPVRHGWSRDPRDRPGPAARNARRTIHDPRGFAQ